jgi:hypothetical protein
MPRSPDSRPQAPPQRIDPDAGELVAPDTAVDETRFVRVLHDAVTALDEAGVFHLVIGGIGSTLVGRERWTWDIDLLVAPDDARAALVALGQAGFTCEETDRQWLFKAFRGDVLVDVIFQSAGGLHLDDEMRRRATTAEFKGVQIRLAAPEDLVVMKALAHREETPRYWHDALAIIARTPLDWDYLVARARYGPRRILSLLAYAQSEDLLVPDSALRALFEAAYN